MTGQLNFDLRGRAGTATGDRSDPRAARLPQAGAAPVRAKVHKRPRVQREADDWHIRELIRTIHRMWRSGPDAPPNPSYKPNGIRERSLRCAQQSQ